jgi:hypothetical protein
MKPETYLNTTLCRVIYEIDFYTRYNVGNSVVIKNTGPRGRPVVGTANTNGGNFNGEKTRKDCWEN